MIIIDDKEYLTPREAATFLAIPLSTIYSWCRLGSVTLLDPAAAKMNVGSKYLIEVKSLKLRHARVHLG